MKKLIRVILTVLPLFVPVAGKAAPEKNDAFLLSGKNYELRLNRTSGAVESIHTDGQELTLANRGTGLWCARFIDGSTLSAQKVTKATRPDSNRLILHYDTASLAVSVTVTSGEEHVDFQATMTPRKKAVVEFSIPGRLSFSPEAVNGVICHLVQGLQPVEQLQILYLGQIAAEGLVQVVMGVDEAGIDDAPGGVDDLLRLLFLRADVGDNAVLHQ